MGVVGALAARTHHTQRLGVGAVLVGLLLWAAPASHADTLSWGSPQLVTGQPPTEQPALSDVTCPSAGLCLALSQADAVLASTSPALGASSWHVVSQLAVSSPPTKLACASVSWCMVVTATGGVFTSTTPATGGFTRGPSLRLAGAYSGPLSLACPAVGRCYLLPELGPLHWLRNGRWRATKLGPLLPTPEADWIQIGCRGSVCAITFSDGGTYSDSDGEALVSSDPTGGAGAWTRPRVNHEEPWDPEFEACPGGHLCLISDSLGDLISSAPVTRQNLRRAEVYGVVSCSSPQVCVDTDGGDGADTSDHDIVVASRPFSGRMAWRKTSPGALGPDGPATTSATSSLAAASPTTNEANFEQTPAALACPSLTLCVSVNGWPDDLFTSTDPFDSSPWQAGDLGAGSTPLGSISCPSTTLCLAASAIDDQDQYEAGALVTGDPQPGAPAWTTAWFSAPIEDLQCPSTRFCFAFMRNGEVATTSDPAAGPWSVLDAAPAAGSGAPTPAVIYPRGPFACPSTDLCVAGDGAGGGVESLAITGTQASTTDVALTAQQPCESIQVGCVYRPSLTAIACSDDHFCAATDGTDLWVSTDPTAGTPQAWNRSALPKPTSALACPSAGTCVGLDAAGHALEVSTDAADAAPRWQAIPLTASGVGATELTCASTDFCLLSNPATASVDQVDLDSGVNQIEPVGTSLAAVGCVPGSDTCVGVDAEGRAVLGTPPA